MRSAFFLFIVFGYEVQMDDLPPNNVRMEASYEEEERTLIHPSLIQNVMAHQYSSSQTLISNEKQG